MRQALHPIRVVSSHTRPDMTGPVNHAVYCRRHGYSYLFDASPYYNEEKYDQKLNAIIENLAGAEWLVWLDDDVYITQQQTKLETFIPVDPQVHFIVADGRVRPPSGDGGKWAGAWTVFNAGVIMVRNSPVSLSALTLARETSIQTVKDWWEEAEHGYFTNGDQDKILYALIKLNLLNDNVMICDHRSFNARVYHYEQAITDNFAVHLCGQSDKSVGIAGLRTRFNLNKYLLSDSDGELIRPHEREIFSGKSLRKESGPFGRLGRILRRLLRAR